ncbi:MAG: hypothetical protein QF632_03150 [Candidatus Woesearchaeota archaeon]|jgi:hypothetical protein|nr:hypothetical protein [Candidatus Woesearchaeota archaeon]MDP7457837.1 hypothetical protein [Candidatus Woesearchaeota archaeon]
MIKIELSSKTCFTLLLILVLAVGGVLVYAQGTQSHTIVERGLANVNLFFDNGKVGIGNPIPSSALDVSGNVEIDGTIKWKCPPDTTRLGMWCVDNTARPVAAMGPAIDTCHALGRNVCGYEVMRACDTIAPVTSDCTVNTDAGNPLVQILTSSSIAVNSQSVLSHFCYGGDNIARICNNAAQEIYYCCSLAVG